MARQFQTVALTGKYSDPRVGDSMTQLANHLAGKCIRVLADPGAGMPAELPVEALAAPALVQQADLMIAVGGDGTMLYAARLAAPHQRPLVGINRGRLGFLADITRDEMIERVDEILGGEYVEEQRLMLEATLTDGDQSERGIALNDVVLQKRETGRTIDFENWINGVFVNAHRGDGLIIATPTGSTAYALSGGGPIIHPSLGAVTLVPICPHTLSDRPIVVSAESRLEVRLIERSDAQAEITCDGHVLGALSEGARLHVRAADERAILLHPRHHDYFRLLRSKLHWGRGKNNGTG